MTALGGAHGNRLVRSRDEKVLGGVCGGLAAKVGVEPIVLRLALVGLVLSGVGVLVPIYIAASFALPRASTGSGAAVERPVNKGMVGWALVALGGSVVIGELDWVSAPMVLASAAIALGINLVLCHRAEEDDAGEA